MRVSKKTKQAFRAVIVVILAMLMVFAAACSGNTGGGDVCPDPEAHNHVCPAPAEPCPDPEAHTHVCPEIPEPVEPCPDPEKHSDPSCPDADAHTPDKIQPGEPRYEGNYAAKNMYAENLKNSGNFTAEYETLEELYIAGADLGERIGEEGFILLHNADNALPLKKGAAVSLLGGHSRFPRRSGGGSGSAYNTAQYPAANDATFVSSLEDAGFDLNPNNLGFTGQGVDTIPNETAQETYASYGDAAVVVFGRGGAEGSDLGAGTPTTAHSLKLSSAEQALVRHAKANFSKVILVLNAANAMEMTELVKPKSSDLGVDAIIQVGHIGADSIAAFGRILNGTVNPSGHTVVVWEADFTKGPTFTNMGAMTQNGTDEYGVAYSNQMYGYNEDTETWTTAAAGGNRTSEYREDIYMGYKFYESVAVDKNAKAAGTGDAWYEENVVFPFGYGLSYTSFKWELDPSIVTTGLIKASNRTVTMKVKVTNTGAVPGKEVVQIYATPPYKNGGIEKAAVNLMGFAKTKLLRPGQSDTVTVQFTAQDMASFDWNDKNKNSFKGYELEAGDYKISARSDSNTVKAEITRTVTEDILCETDLMTGKEIKAAFSQDSGYLAIYNSTRDSLLDNLLSREGGLDGTQPKAADSVDRRISQEFLNERINIYSDTPGYGDKATDPWYVSQVPTRWTQASDAQAVARADGKTPIQIQDMIGVPYTHPIHNEDGTITVSNDEGSIAWDNFMNQMTWEELEMFSISGGWGRRPIRSIGKPGESDVDGPCQLNAARNGANARVSSSADLNAQRAEVLSTAFASGTIIAATWNVDITEEQGIIVGNFALYGNVVGWYAPGVNLHRSPFSGRNFEYYSEDGLLTGKMAGALVRGCSEKGLVIYAKHMFLNDDETNRDGKNTFVTEQAIREIYLKPYELIIKEAGGMGFMAGMNRVGTRSCYANYALLNDVLREEMGFKGTVITDADSVGGRQRTHGIKFRAGTDMNLGRATQILNNASQTADGSIINVEPTIWDPALRGGKGGIKVAANNADRRAAHEAIGDNNATGGFVGDYEDTSIPAGVFTQYKHEQGLWDDMRNKAPAASYLTVEAPTHYYWLRQAVMHLLYNSAQSAAMNNRMPSGIMHSDTVYTIEVTGTRTGSGAGATVGFNKTNIFAGITELEPYRISDTRLVNGLDGIGDFKFTGVRVNKGTNATAVSAAMKADTTAANIDSAAGVRMIGGVDGNRFPAGITITDMGDLQSITDAAIEGLTAGTYELIIKTRLENWHGISVRLLLTIV